MQTTDGEASAVTSTPSPTGTAAKVRGHIPALDGVRGLAILLVLWRHSTLVGVEGGLGPTYEKIARLGWTGVDLFFVLSGFLITGILYDTKKRTSYFKSFYARRLVRIFPVYYLFLIIVFVVLPMLGRAQPTSPAWWYWTYTSNIWFSVGGWPENLGLAATWSLAIEEQFYMLWPLVVFMLGRKNLLRACGVMVVTALALRIAIRVSDMNHISNYVLLPTRMDALAMGAFVALYLRGAPDETKTRARAKIAFFLGAAATLGLIVAAWSSVQSFHNDAIMDTLGFSALAVMGAATILLLVTAPETSRARTFFESRFLRTFGKYSYAVYLVNIPVRAAVKPFLTKDGNPEFMGSVLVGQLALHVVIIFGSLAVAFFSWHLFEKHFLKLKRYFPRPE